MDAASLVASICMWQAYTLHSTVPPNAAVIGYQQWKPDCYKNVCSGKAATAIYAARTTYDSRPTVVLQYDGWASGLSWLNNSAVKGFNYVDFNAGGFYLGEILVCNPTHDRSPNGGKPIKLLWKRFDAGVTNLEHCVAFGKNHLGETMYLARIKVVPNDCPSSTKDYQALVPAIFTPSHGFAVGDFCGPTAKDDFQLFCL